MTRVLHITDGSATADHLRAAGVDGRVLPWREALVDGRAPAADDSVEEWIERRVRWLTRAYGVPAGPARDAWREQAGVLAGAANDFDRVLLWFGDDLFCRVNVLAVTYLLTRGGQVPAQVSMAQPPASAGDVATGVDGARDVELDPRVEREAWSAWASPNAGDLGRLRTLAQGFPLETHLDRFPEEDGGLSMHERLLVESLDGGTRSFAEVLDAFTRSVPSAGFGDWQVWSVLRRLAAGDAVLLRTPEGRDVSRTRPAGRSIAEAQVTAGRRAEEYLTGAADLPLALGRSWWLGGARNDGSWRRDRLGRGLARSRRRPPVWAL